ncbi:MAG: thiamine-phosphate kinase [Methylophilaceae bacterium]
MSSEFNLIQQYFNRPTQHTNLSVGDDSALISISAGMELAISVDMLVAGTHFFADCDAYLLGWKSLAVNISDMAAMGANAKWATLAIALPEVNTAWLANFSRGFFACAASFNVDLIGGDTTRGPLTISVQIMGEVPTGKAIKRHGANADEDIWVTGTLGSAALGLAHLKNNITLDDDTLETCLLALHKPMPRSVIGLALQNIATSCIDISDGLLADLGHILKASNKGATLNLESIPCHDYLRQRISEPYFQKLMVAGGDDYELCFTAPKSCYPSIIALRQRYNLPICQIGQTHSDLGLNLQYKGNKLNIEKEGYDHFD